MLGITQDLETEFLSKSQFKINYQTPGGSQKILSFNFEVMTVEQSTHPRLLCLIEDITERAQKEALLHEIQIKLEQTESEKWRGQMVHQKLFGVIECDLQIRITNVNEVFCNLIGYKASELIGQPISLFTNTEDWATNTQQIAKMRLTGEPFKTEKRYRHRDGSEVWAHVAVGVILDSAGEIESFMGFVQDITASKRAEQRLNLAVTGARQGTWSWDIQRDTLTWSDYMCVLFGIPPGTPMDLSKFLGTLHPEDREATAKAVSDSVANATDYEKEFRIIWPDGNVHWIVGSGRVYYAEDRKPQYMEGIVMNIDARKQAEFELLEERQRLSEAQTIAHIASWTEDLNGKFHWPPEVYNTWGISLVNKISSFSDCEQLIFPDDQASLRTWRALCRNGKNPGSVVVRRFLANGTLRYLSLTSELQHGTDGKALRLLNTVQDVTEIWRKDELIRLNEERHRFALDTNEIGEWEMDLGNQQIMTSGRHDRIFGYDQPVLKWTYEKFIQHVVEEDRPFAASIYQEACDGRASLDFQLRIHRNDEAIRWVHYRGQKRRTEDGRHVLVGIIVDITPAKEAEIRLLESENRFRSLFEYLPVAYQSIDFEGHWVDANKHMADLLGYPNPEAMRGRHFVDCWDDSIKDTFNAVYSEFRKNHKMEIELKIRRLDGQLRTVHLAGRLQMASDGSNWRTHCVIVDITERRALERQIMNLNSNLEKKVAARTRQLETANAAKSLFLASMSHEIRTPMHAVLGLAQILHTDKLDQDQKDILQKIIHSGKSLLGILNDILDFSKIEAGQLPIETRPFALGEIIEQVLSVVEVSTQTKGLRLQIENDQPINGLLLGDSQRLNQVLINLTSNAVKFTDNGTITIRVKPLIVEATKTRIRFEVEDTGIGINADSLTRLFNPFSQADSSINRRFGGTGLGLSICKRIVDLLGGTIGAESRPGVGSLFWVELPFERAEKVTEPTVRLSNSDPQGQRLAGLRLLVADDNQVNLFLADRALQREGAQTTLVHDGQQALEALRANPQAFDAALMDIQMPVMDGLEATRAIRSELHLESFPIIALTAGVLAEEREEAMRAGLNDLLPKPMDFDQMANMIAGYCHKKSEIQL